MPSVRADGSARPAVDGAHRDPPTCAPDTVVGTVDAPVLVINEERVVLGRVPTGRHHVARVEDVMQPGPTTVRAYEPLHALLARMAQRHVHEIVVTTSEGRLIGVVRRP